MIFVFSIFVCIDKVFYLIFHPVTNFISVELNSSIFQVALMLRISNSFMNPILFTFRNKNFRSRIQSVIGISSTCKYHNGECLRLFCVKCERNRVAYHNIHEIWREATIWSSLFILLTFLQMVTECFRNLPQLRENKTIVCQIWKKNKYIYTQTSWTHSKEITWNFIF